MADDDFPPTHLSLVHDRGKSDEVFLWTAPPIYTSDTGKILLAFTRRDLAEQYAEIMAAEIMADEMIIPNELQTRDLADLAHLLHLVYGLEAVGLDIDTAASRLYQIDEFYRSGEGVADGAGGVWNKGVVGSINCDRLGRRGGSP